MDDNDNNDHEEDLGKFRTEEDRIKPIDFGASPAPSPSPASEEADGQGKEAAAAPEPFLKDEEFPDEPPAAENNSKLAAQAKEVTPGGPEPNYIHKDEYIDITESVPTLKRIIIGAGWDQRSMEEMVDVDLSLFLCNKHDQTRIDEDFIFYNNARACDGAVQHRSDSRTGAGAGDDESIFIDLNGLPFDILKIVCVVSIYDPDIKGHHFGMVDNIYIRIANKDDNEEIFRYKLDQGDCKGGNAIIIGTLIREGPKWIFEASAHGFNGGLAKVATDYGIIVKELQSTLEVDQAIDKAQPED